MIAKQSTDIGKISLGDIEIAKVSLGANEVFSSEVFSGIYLAQDSDFSGTTNGAFRYIGTETEVRIPHIIKGVSVTSYARMFEGTSVTKVVSDNPNVTDMYAMFYNSTATTLDLSSFNTSSVTNMRYMLRDSAATTLDLSSFNTSSVTNMGYMFRDSAATAGYARTQADADKFNASSGKPATLNFIVR